MLANIPNMFRVADLRNKILFTIFILAIYRLGSFIPAPYIDFNAVQLLRENASEGGILAILSLFSGSALTQFAVFALGIMPYITASIIMQILGVVIPKIEQWQQQGAVGQRKITQWTRYMTIAIAVIQSTSFAFLFHNPSNSITNTGGTGIDLLPDFRPVTVSIVVLTLTAGTALLMWMGELITQRGIGNGMSLIIFASVIASFPFQGVAVYEENGVVPLILFIAMILGLIVAIVYVEQGQRRIPVQFAKKVVGRRMFGGQNTYIPLKVNQSGVIPIIFASSVLYLPQLLAVTIPWEGFRNFVNDELSQTTSPWYYLIFGLLIVGFAYFYTAITFDPAKQADTIRKQGGFIPGIRPGPQTERYLAKVLSRITLPGALFILAVALLPSLIVQLAGWSSAGGHSGGGGGFGFIGISILIAAGVALETMRQIDSQLTMRNYEGFLK